MTTEVGRVHIQDQETTITVSTLWAKIFVAMAALIVTGFMTWLSFMFYEQRAQGVDLSATRERVAVLEAQQRTTRDTLTDIRTDVLYIRNRLDAIARQDKLGGQ